MRLPAVFAAVVLFCSVAPHTQRIVAPGLVLWAWERPEDLRFIDPATTGIAYLAATASIHRDGSVAWRFRQQPLATPPHTTRIAVVRIESPPQYVFPEPAGLVEPLVAAAKQRDVEALQIDFDARASERRFYRSLLEQLRKTINVPIGITALASWCESDNWIDANVVSEAVPMFFRMGLGESKNMPMAPICRHATGVSTDEPWPSQHPGRLYVFNPKPWTEAAYREVLKNQ
jgi:hypothetical protein